MLSTKNGNCYYISIAPCFGLVYILFGGEKVFWRKVCFVQAPDIFGRYLHRDVPAADIRGSYERKTAAE